MKSYLADFNAISAAQREMDRAQMLHDLNTEMSGADTGRMVRVRHADTDDATIAGKRGKQSSDALSALDLALMSDPAYADLYHDTFDNLRDAETATERALAKVEQALTDAKAALETTLDRAATLDDGTRIFKDTQGHVWTEHGERVDPVIASRIEWQGHEPTRETYLIREQAVADAHDDIAELRGYQVTLGEFRERMSDEGNPITVNELEKIAERTSTEMPELARREFDAIQGIDAPASTITNAALPTLGD